MKICVIGAGIAGLTSAFKLTKAGYDVTVFEKENFVAGRTRSIEVNGFILDTGAQFFYSAYKNVFSICKELGIENQLTSFKQIYGMLRDKKLHLLNPNSKNPLQFLLFKGLSAPTKIFLLKLITTVIINSSKFALINLEKSIDFDNETVREYCIKHLNQELLDYLGQPVASALTLGTPDDLSAAIMLAALKYHLFCKLYTLKNGVGFLAKTLSEKCNVQTQHEVTKVILKNNKVKAVEIYSPSGKKEIACDIVISAVPAPLISQIIPEIPEDSHNFISKVKYSPCINIMFATERKTMDNIYAVGIPAREGLSIVVAAENTIKCSNNAPPNKGLITALPYNAACRDMFKKMDTEIEKIISLEIKSIFPDFTNNPIFCKIFRWNNGLPLFGTGYIKALCKFREMSKKIEGLYFAGDYTQSSSVEGALYSGIVAANAIQINYRK